MAKPKLTKSQQRLWDKYVGDSEGLILLDKAGRVIPPKDTPPKKSPPPKK